MAQKLKYLGVPVYMNGQNYYVPSLSLLQFKSHYSDLTAPPADDATALATFDKFVPIIWLALTRNYPDITQEQLADWLDLTTFRQAIAAVQSASGIVPVSEGE